MIYRKPGSQPRQLLLRVAAPAGMLALLGNAGACSSNDAVNGSVTMPGDAAADHEISGSFDSSVCNPCGVVANPEASDNDVFVGGGVVGLVVNPGDAGDAGDADNAFDAHREDVFNGVVVHPGDGGGDQ